MSMWHVLPVQDISFRWASPGLFTDQGGDIVAWFSMRVGPLYLNNGQIEVYNGKVEVNWPRLRQARHFWWRPCDASFEEQLKKRMLREFALFLDAGKEGHESGRRQMLAERMRASVSGDR